ncbi:anaphase-promoting complex subunit 5-domain-containing protein [Obelidium mucronatum]|nr:anaphase-promoting complex subunit 5-domain-containing protein [Obelidium mucronatum]
MILSQVTFLCLIVVVEYCIEEKAQSWLNRDAPGQTMLLLLELIRSPPATLEALLEKLSSVNASNGSGDELAVSLKTMATYQLSKITLISHVDAIFDLAEAIVSEPANSMNLDETFLVLKKTSEFGIFVRRIVLDYRSFNFKEVAAFFDSIIVTRNRIVGDDNAQTTTSMDVEQNTGKMDTFSLISADRYLDSLVLNPNSWNDTDVIIKSVMEINSAVPECVKAYYIEHLIATRNGDFATALSKLHQFFDYGAIHTKKSMRHYAPLHVAIMHTAFGHFERARAYLDEAVSVARYVKDQECLNHCLSLGIKLQATAVGSAENSLSISKRPRHTHPQAEALRNLASESKSLKMMALEQEGELGQAKMLNRVGQGKEVVLDALKRARAIVSAEENIIEGNALYVDEGCAFAVENTDAEIWSCYGHSTVADLHLNSWDFLAETEDSGNVDEVIVGLVMRAKKQSLVGCSAEAQSLLNRAKSIGGVSNVQAMKLWLFVEKSINFHDALNKFKSPVEMQVKLSEVMAAAKLANNIDWILEAKFMEAQMFARVGQIEKALDVAAKLITEAKLLDREFLCIPYLLFLAELHLSQGLGHAALPLILSCITLSKAYSQHQETRNAYVLLARFFVHSWMTGKAVQTIESVLGPILVHGTSKQKGMALHTLAQCLCVEWKEKSTQTSSANGQNPTRILLRFDQAIKVYESVGCVLETRQVHFEKAKFLHMLGTDYVMQRNAAAAQFRALDEQIRCLR